MNKFLIFVLTLQVLVVVVNIAAIPKKGQPVAAKEDDDDDDDEDNKTTVSWSDKVDLAEKEYQKLGLKLHNDYRACHNAAPLRRRKKLNKIAINYARKLIRDNNFINEVANDDDSAPRYLQNIFQLEETGVSSPVEPLDVVKRAVDGWYSEIKDYDWENPSPTTFSQVVWNETTRLGIGMAIGKQGNIFRQVVVAAYSPPGNMNGGDFFQKNVFPKKT